MRIESSRPILRFRQVLMTACLVGLLLVSISCGGIREGKERSETEDVGGGEGGSREDDLSAGAAISQRTYLVSMVSADRDTVLDQYLDTQAGLREQCDVLNKVVRETCCGEYDLGCGVSYDCSQTEDASLGYLEPMPQYLWDNGQPTYSIHHGTPLATLKEHLESLQAQSRVHGRLLLAYTRHRIVADDEETKNPAQKINPEDLSYHFLGLMVPGLSDRGGRRIVLDAYVTKSGALISVTPIQATALAQALAEYRGSNFSFDGKQLTGGGSRTLFEYKREHLVPNYSGCQALTELEAAYLPYETGGEQTP